MKKKRALWLAIVLMACAAMLGVNAMNKNTKITVAVPKMEQTRPFEGWGTALCWWANRIGYSDTLSQKAAELFYGKDGMHMNIMRYNIGGGDDPTHHHITRTDSEVPGWLKWNEETQTFEYDYTADKNQLNVLMRSVEAAGKDAVVEVFANSPPYFMTVSGCASGAVNANDNNLREDCYDEFAEYLVHVTDHIQHELGVKVTSLSPMNEPNTDFWPAYSWKQEGCHYDQGEVQNKMILATARALENSKSANVIVAVSDETSPEKQFKEYEAYSPEARKALGRINTHTYMDDDAREALGELARRENVNLWMSEVDGSGVEGENAGEMGSALWMGKKIITDINTLMPTAWVMWQAIDHHISADGWNGNKDNGMADVNGGFWGLAVANHDTDEIILTQKYYGMGQFSRYIRPGSYLIPCTDETLAAYHPEKQELVIVSLNTTASERQMQFDLSAYARKDAVAQAFRTSGSISNGEHWTPTGAWTLDEQGLTASLPANSITTWVIENVKP